MTGDARQVETRLGAVRGQCDDGVYSWRGIPFAAPPIGPLRFRAPQPAEPWAGVRDATEYAQPCVQLPFFSAIDAPIRGGEDCLTLNIWSPRPDGKLRPVLFWIHGGGWVMGAGARFDGALLAARGDVVVVTVNYRLGPWGFLWLGDLDPEHFKGCANPGLLDLVAALRWVSENIAGFGGDPGNVTIFGESAGGMLTGTLLATPAAKGLFHRAIAQSGAARNVRDRATGTRLARRLLALLDIAPEDARRLDDVPMEALYRAGAALVAESCADWIDVEPFLPVIDGETLPHHPTTAIAEGAGHAVPLIVMTCRDEMTIMEPECPEVLDGKDAHIRYVLGEADYARVTAAYAAATEAPRQPRMEFLTGVMFRTAAIRLAEASAKAGAPVWMARMDYRLSLTPFKDVGASHLTDVLLLFETHSDWGETVAGHGTLADRIMADRLQKLVIGFARTGIASSSTVDSWPRYDAETRATLILDRQSRIEHDPLAAQRRAWDGISLH